jgi:bifunctional non-homologous end joining protein LigD
MSTPDRLTEYRRKRDFRKTREPKGATGSSPDAARAFVVQKHDASRLHFDLRLEVDGVMKSWAVPKGPSLDPAVRRLAVQVEDHPREYNDFEGTIPAGEYGGGTVMIWDRGTYSVDGLATGGDPDGAMRKGLKDGKLSISFQGDRLNGSFALVRTRGSPVSGKAEWLLLKHRDRHAGPEVEPAEAELTSVVTGRTMDEIASGTGGTRVWSSRRGEVETEPPKGHRAKAGSLPAAANGATGVAPMLATPSPEPPRGPGWIFEPKWDGIRVVAYAAGNGVALLTRNGNDKARQFPELVSALRSLRASAGRDLVLDGEVVATLDGEVVRFESLQSRMHRTSRGEIQRLAEETPAAFMAFDLLVDGEEVLVHEPWSARRERLEALLKEHGSESVALSDASGSLESMLERARTHGWEGLIAKETASVYRPGERSRSWRKVKLENRQEFVVGGWTEPRNSREYIGSLLLGYHDADGSLAYAGHTGTGFTREMLRELHRRLARLERKTPPFSDHPRTNEPAHWTTPKVVVEVRFNEWTAAGKLRQPVFIGLRDDKNPRDVVREPAATEGEGKVTARGDGEARDGKGKTVKSAEPRGTAGRAGKGTSEPAGAARIVEKLKALEADRRAGELPLPGGVRLNVTNLDKVYFPRQQFTKGALLRYYAAMSRHILPWMKDRPLVLKRFPHGIEGESFYQQTPDERVPEGVRVVVLNGDDGEEQRRLVGGTLATLLYTVQLGAISYDPWHSRVGRLDHADYTVIDLDPGPGATFRTVIRVARSVREVLDEAALTAALKTSGSRGLHIYVPLPSRTPLEAATLVAQIIATRVAERHPKIATVERMTRKRPRGTVYVDYLQNILGKTIAGVYACRARPGATVSTPLEWDELTDTLDAERFTIETVPDRVGEVGDLWSKPMRARNSLAELLPRRPS